MFSAEDFKSYAVEMPEYASLFTTYHKLKESANGNIFADPLDAASTDSDNQEADIAASPGREDVKPEDKKTK